jgi:hypothetical protein
MIGPDKKDERNTDNENEGIAGRHERHVTMLNNRLTAKICSSALTTS